MTKHGYDVKADNVFWCKQGILRSTDLRDSMDEQCIADIVASIVSGTVLERSKDALDNLYEKSSEICNHLNYYGKDKIKSEFLYFIDQIKKICEAGDAPNQLRKIIFEGTTTNSFPATFSLLFIALHEKFTKDKLSISSYKGLKESINNITRRLDTSRRSTSAPERQKNIKTIKGVIEDCFFSEDPSSSIYSDHKASDIESYIRRSGQEVANYELKQGIVSLDGDRKINIKLLDRITKTICAIANNGPDRSGRILIGVSDKEDDTQRIEKLDKIQPRKVGDRSVVGVHREAKRLNMPFEKYFSKIREHIDASTLSQPLKNSVLSSIDFNDYYGLGIIVISIPPQKEPSYLNDKIYWRNGDHTEEATSAKAIASIIQRF
ncbi:AlbA family DNA-binding domain-containing protein [Bombella mellum]|uniref:AlbA family DNA-binding domain-containing protein n=1 Tax=Bombella mellum TaxID=2039288 RepID=UPI001E34D11F|nr:ATP-binding protein [Bombella mellum]